MKIFLSLCRFDYKYKQNELNDLVNNSKSKIKINIDNIIEKVMQPSIYNSSLKINQNEYINYDLFEYQKHSIKWMLNKEINKSKIHFNTNDEILVGDIFIDLYKRKYYKKDKESITFHGGCIIDEVGLGKTIQITTLSLINNSKNASYYYNNYMFNSRATLILCPNQLGGQWIRELNNTVSSKYKPKILKIFTKTHFNKYSYKDLLEADFIVVSFTFLNNKEFIKSWTQNKNPYDYKYDFDKIDQLFKDIGFKHLLDPFNSLDKKIQFFQ